MGNDLMIDELTYGAAMQKLNERQRLYVLARVWRGFSQTDAAAWAGYSPSGNRDSLAVLGHHLAHNPQVIAAVREETEQLKDDEGAASLRTLIEIRDDPTTEKKDRIRCATELLDRAGYHKQTEHTLHVDRAEPTPEEYVKSIMQMTKELGFTPEQQQKLLGRCYVDAEFEEVPPAPQRELSAEEQKEKAARDRENEQRRSRRKMSPDELAAHKAKTRAKKSERLKLEYLQQQNGGTVADEDTIAATPDDDLSDIL